MPTNPSPSLEERTSPILLEHQRLTVTLICAALLSYTWLSGLLLISVERDPLVVVLITFSSSLFSIVGYVLTQFGDRPTVGRLLIVVAYAATQMIALFVDYNGLLDPRSYLSVLSCVFVATTLLDGTTHQRYVVMAPVVLLTVLVMSETLTGHHGASGYSAPPDWLIRATCLFMVVIILLCIGLLLRNRTAKLRQALEVSRLARDSADVLKARNEALQQSMVQIRESELAQTRFRNKLSEEVLEPLNDILDQIKRVSSTDSAADHKQQLYAALSAGRQFKTILNELGDRGATPLSENNTQIQRFPVEDLLKSLYRVLRHAGTGNKQMRIEFEDGIDSLPSYVLGDVIKLRQILNSVVIRALIMMPEQARGIVKIGYSYDTESLAIRVLTSLSEDEQTARISKFDERAYSLTGSNLKLATLMEWLEDLQGRFSIETDRGSISICLSVKLPPTTREEAD